MKKLLFFGYTLDMGGAEKVMVDFINILKPHYDIDLALIKAQGELMSALPQGVGVIEMRKGLLSYILFRFVPIFRKHKINKIAAAKDYDVAIGFIEGRSATWVADIKKDIRRLAWVHNDVDFFDIGISQKEIINSYSRMDTIVTVAEQSRVSFARKYGFDEEKISVLYNLINEEKIARLAEETVEGNDCFTFVNVGRMRPQKRQDRLISIARRLKDKGFRFKIQILGDGPEEDNIKALIKENGVEDVVELKGLVLNPYPYIKQADCVVVSSDFEGYSIAVKEALFLKKAMISTDVSGVKEIFEGNRYGIVTERSTDALYDKMEQALDGRLKLKELEKALETFDGGNDAIVKQLFSLIEKDI